MWVQSVGWEDSLEEGTTTHSSILAWRVPWPEEPGGTQSIGSHRVGHDWSNSWHMHAHLSPTLTDPHRFHTSCSFTLITVMELSRFHLSATSRLKVLQKWGMVSAFVGHYSPGLKPCTLHSISTQKIYVEPLSLFQRIILKIKEFNVSKEVV